MMTVNITLRIPANLAPLIDDAARADSLSRHAWIIASLREAVSPQEFDENLVLGYIELLRGELRDADCSECGLEFGDRGVFIGFVAGKYRPLAFGPVCGSCATTE